MVRRLAGEIWAAMALAEDFEAFLSAGYMIRAHGRCGR